MNGPDEGGRGVFAEIRQRPPKGEGAGRGTEAAGGVAVNLEPRKPAMTSMLEVIIRSKGSPACRLET